MTHTCTCTGTLALTFSAAALLGLSTARAQDPQPQPQPQPYPQQPQPYQAQPQPYPQQQQQGYPQQQQQGYPQQQPYAQPYAQQQPQQTVYIADYETPANKITLKPIDLFFFGAIDVEYERALGNYFSLAAGVHLNLWEPLEGDVAGHGVRIQPRVYPLGDAPRGFFIAGRFEYLYIDHASCIADSGVSTLCDDSGQSGAAVGMLAGYDILAGDRFALSFAIGAVYSSLGNPEWTLYAPSMRVDDLDGEDPTVGKVIPFFRLGVGFAF